MNGKRDSNNELANRIEQSENDRFAELVERAAAAVRAIPMAYGSPGVAFYAILDTINILYGLAYGASYVEVKLAGAEVETTLAKCDKELVPSTRDKHWSGVAVPAPRGESPEIFQITVGLLDDKIADFANKPNLLSYLLGRQGVADTFASAIRQYRDLPKPELTKGRRRGGLETHNDRELYRELDDRIRYAIDYLGAHSILSKKIVGADLEDRVAIFVVAHRVPGERILDGHTFLYQYRFILSTGQSSLLSKADRESLEAPPRDRERYRSRSDTSFEGENVTTYNRRSPDSRTRIAGKMDDPRANALDALRRSLDIEQGVFQLYVPIHVDGRVVFVVAFHLPDALKDHAFEVYSSFVPSLATAFRHCIMETLESRGLTGVKRERTLDRLCGCRKDPKRERFIRVEPTGNYGSNSRSE